MSLEQQVVTWQSAHENATADSATVHELHLSTCVTSWVLYEVNVWCPGNMQMHELPAATAPRMGGETLLLCMQVQQHGQRYCG
jgi:hypothetical protein